MTDKTTKRFKIIHELPDVQNGSPSIKRPIPQVGVQNIQMPILIESREGGFRETVASVTIKTDIGEETRGISMSRLHLTLDKHIRKPLKQTTLIDILGDMNRSIGAKSSFITFYFKLPINRISPKSGFSFPIFHDCKFEAQLTDKGFCFFQGVTTRYTSYCPCSAELSKSLREQGSDGFPHAQRAYATVLIENEQGIHSIWLEDIIDVVEQAVVSVPYPIVKREDEQEIARVAAENPMFVEDAIRAISEGLDDMKGVYDWIVKCVHEESIHESEAIAINWKGIASGFKGIYFT